MHRLKILISTDFYPPYVSGVSTAAYNLSLALSKRGHQVFVITVGKRGSKKVQNLNPNLKVYRFLGLKNPFYRNLRISYLPLLKVREILKKEDPDVIHIHSFLGTGISSFLQAKSLGVPLVATNHGLPENMSAVVPLYKVFKRIYDDQFWNYARFFHTKCDFFFAPTSFADREFVRNVPVKNHGVVSNGIDLTYWGENVLSQEEAREALKLPKGKKILLFVGRISAEKRIDFLIKALKPLLESREIILVVVGSGPKLPIYKELLRELKLKNKVIFTGEIKDETLKKYYQAVDLFVSASKGELQGLSVLEGASYGLPLVVAKSGALPELISGNGYTFSADDREDFRKEVLKILNSPQLQEKLSNQSKIIAQKHSMDEVIKKFEKIYLRVSKLKKKKEDSGKILDRFTVRLKEAFSPRPT